MNKFLPTTKQELDGQADFILVTGDSYVDHPSFGVAIIGRYLESLGYKVGIIAQPNLNSSDLAKLGEPKYAFMVTSGNIDSMVSLYTAAKRKRSDDPYSAGGKSGRRPERAVIKYSKALKGLFPTVPVVLGGLEASLRRFAHYDYWSDTVMPSILVDSGADLLVYGMGERAIKEIADCFKNNSDMTKIKGTCVLIDDIKASGANIIIPSYEKVSENKDDYLYASKVQLTEQDSIIGKTICQPHGKKILKQNPPQEPLSREELDAVFALPYARAYHPSYESLGGVPAIEEVEMSIIQNRGCFGGCNFCSITFHQGREVVSRSKDSILREGKLITESKNFKGFIHDVGGPTANFRHRSCKKQLKSGMCKDKKCLGQTPCINLEVSHDEYVDILKELAKLPKVKKVFVRSGLRFDYIMKDENKEILRELVKNHISGQLKVAPEHSQDNVLALMGKPKNKVYEEFSALYEKYNREYKMDQYIVPYLMSSHPGSGLKEAVSLALYLKKKGIRAEQVQDFYPTPGTASTTMFYTGKDPYTGKKVYVPRTTEEKAMQRALLQSYKPENRRLVEMALRKCGRDDLIGKNGLIGVDYKKKYENAEPYKPKPGYKIGKNNKRKKIRIK